MRNFTPNLRQATTSPHEDDNQQCSRALEHAHAQGALKALKTLWLVDNKIGDEGMRHLGDALARGAAPALEKLKLWTTASDAAKQALRDARPGLEIN